MKTCPDCNGDGVVEKGTDDERQCPTCGGSGFVPDDEDGREEIIHTQRSRLRSRGRGYETSAKRLSALPPKADIRRGPPTVLASGPNGHIFSVYDRHSR